MLNLPREIIALTTAFAPYFSEPVWQQGQLLMVGAILALGRRTVASALPCTDASSGIIATYETDSISYRICPPADPAQVLTWFALRWQLEVTFQEVCGPC